MITHLFEDIAVIYRIYTQYVEKLKRLDFRPGQRAFIAVLSLMATAGKWMEVILGEL